MERDADPTLRPGVISAVSWIKKGLISSALTLFGKIPELPRRWRVLFAGAAVLLLAFLLYPFKTRIVPRWRLNVVDEARVLGVPDIRVTEHWQHYLLESEGHEEMQKTNQNGLVDFPARTIRASLASRV